MRRVSLTKTAGLLAMTLLATAALSGCTSAPGPLGTASLYVKDAPTDGLSAVSVTFTKAQVQDAAGDWTTVFDGLKTIELLSLNSSTAKEKLADFDLTPGNYSALRIAVSEVEITYADGTTELMNVFGNVVTVAESFTVTDGGDISLLIDFDLDAGLDLDAGTYTPVVSDVQKSSDDHDDDGIDDVEDDDDDGDGIEDKDDDDRDGDDEDDHPEQEHDDEEDLEDFDDEEDDEDSKDGSSDSDSSDSDAEDDHEDDNSTESSTETESESETESPSPSDAPEGRQDA